MLLAIVAVTKTHNGFCVAGVNGYGKLFRPICGFGKDRFWQRESLTHTNEFIKCGDLWELEGQKLESEYPNHTEDFLATSFTYKQKVDHKTFLNNLRRFAENEQAFIDTVNANKRSLCLMPVSTLKLYNTVYAGNSKPRVSVTGAFNMQNPKTQDKLYPVKDCKWERLVLNNYIPPKLEQIFVCIGLATPTPYDGIEYPQVIGIHTLPNIDFPDTYPD